MLCNIRYVPGDPLQTFIATMSNVLTLAAVAVAMTLIVVSAIQKIVGERLPWDRVLRFYLFFAILIWVFAMMYTHFEGVERQKQATLDLHSSTNQSQSESVMPLSSSTGVNDKESEPNGVR